MLARKVIKTLRIKLTLEKFAREKSKTLAKLKKPKIKLTTDKNSRKQSNSKWKKIIAWIKNIPILQEGSYSNEILKNVAWFIIGSTLNIFLYFVLVYQLKLSAQSSCLLCISIGSIFSIGMTFSTTVRCVIFLAIPGFFTSKGRTFLVMYAFILIVNGPMLNFNNNITVMTGAMGCGQEVINNQTAKLLSTALDPLSAMLNGIENFVEKVNDYSRMVQQAFLSMKKGMEEIVASINRLYSWLGNMVNVCNDKMSTPYVKCMAAFTSANKECIQRLWTPFNGLCNMVNIFANTCHLARTVEMLCSVAGAVKSFLREKFVVPTEMAVRNLYDMFYFKVIISHVYRSSFEQTKSYAQVRDDVLRKVKEKLSVFTTELQLFGIPTGLAIVFVFIKAVKYRLDYLSKNKFDNVYLSKTFYQLDKDRTAKGEETLLPLRKSERIEYIDLFTLRLSSREKRKILAGVMFLLISFLTIGFYLFCDYGLFWILDLVRSSLSFKVDKESLPHLKFHVRGKGPYADMFRSMVSLFDPLDDDDAFEKTRSCLPKPNEPDFVVYYTIGAIFCICLVSVILQAYGLRLRHVICGHFYAERAEERLNWLYFGMLLRRGSYLKLMRRKMRLKYQGFFDAGEISMRRKLVSRFPKFNRILKIFGMDHKFCIGCNIEGDIDDRSNFEHCEDEGCGAVYCLDCYYDIQNTCTVCMKPVDYGDLSDEDEEKDSSDDDVAPWGESSFPKRDSLELYKKKKIASV